MCLHNYSIRYHILSRFFCCTLFFQLLQLVFSSGIGYDAGMKGNIKKTIEYILSMREEAWGLLLGTLRLSCVMVFCAFVILIELGAPTIQTLPIWRGAEAYASFPAALLLCATLASAFVDEHLR